MSDELIKLGHKTEIPFTCNEIISKRLSIDEYKKEKEKRGDELFRKQSGEDLIKRYYNLIKESDAIIVVNIEKNGIKNYIGGNTFLEIGFAYTMDKKIYFLNDIPEISYTDELKAMQPIILDGDLSKIS